MKKSILPLCCLLMTLILLRVFFVFVIVSGESMEPTLPAGTFVIGHRYFRNLKVGDIVIFEHESKLLIKRIAALPGDVFPSKYGIHIVPPGHFCALGDNEGNSNDSWYWADPFVPLEDIIGTVIMRKLVALLKTHKKLCGSSKNSPC